MNQSVHLNLDDAWPADPLGMSSVDARAWGPRVRYLAPEALLAQFHRSILSDLPPFVLYGSGDFHHLAAWLLRRRVGEPLNLVSFDNHPDCDVRPPRWACGGWINRALEHPNVRRAAVWGCGNFELDFPSRLFANRRALRSGRLELHPWAERFGPGTRRRFDCMTRDNWRDRFDHFAAGLAGTAVYVTVDLDCVRAQDAVTNWENGLFTPDDIAWAIRRLRNSSTLVGGDLCGAHSHPRFERPTQRLASWWDHPKPPPATNDDPRATNLRTLQTIWPAFL